MQIKQTKALKDYETEHCKSLHLFFVGIFYQFLSSCVDNEKNLFDADQLRQIYEETFPVKNIDPDGDWTMSRSVTAHVSVNGDLGSRIIRYRYSMLNPLSSGKYMQNS